MRIVAAIALLLASLGATSAHAQQAERVPYADFPLQVIGWRNTEGWRATRLMTLYWVYEVGSMSPANEPEGLERNIRGYINGPSNRGQVWATADTQDGDNRIGCVAYHSIQYRPPSAASNEEWIESICLRRPDAPDDTAAVAPFQIGVRRIFHTQTGTIQFLRLWNGTREEMNALLAQYGQSTEISATPNNRQLRAFAPVLRALAEPWAQEVASSYEVCDLSSETPCETLHQPIEGRFVTMFRENTLPNSIAGLVLIRGERAGPQTWEIPDPAPEGARFLVENLIVGGYDFSSGDAGGRTLFRMTEANSEWGGIIAVSARPEVRGQAAPRLRAYLLKLARVIGPVPRNMGGGANGNPPSVPYADMRIDLWPQP